MSIFSDLALAVKAKLDLKANTADVNAALATKANTSSLANVATSGLYADLSGTPTMPVVPTALSSFTNDANYAKTDVAQTFSGAQRTSVATTAYAASVALNLSINNHFAITMTGNLTLANPTNLVAGQEGTITLTQDATGGRSVAWGTYFKFVGGTAPSYVSTPNSKSTFVYHVVDASNIIVVPLIDWK